MGTYYVYANHQRREFVTLSSLRNGGDKLNAVYYCAEALVYLLDPLGGPLGDEYRGRWARHPLGEAPAIEIMSDAVTTPTDLVDAGWQDITADLVESIQRDRGEIDRDRFTGGRFTGDER